MVLEYRFYDLNYDRNGDRGMRHQAIRNVYANAITIDGDSDVWDADGTVVVIDEALVQAEFARLQAEYDSKAYARNRQAEYPSLDELVVALWEGVVEERMASVTALEGLRQAIKTKYPKV
jgi:hypothetical protein